MEARIKGSTRAKELQGYRIKDLEEGKKLIVEIEDASRDTMRQMREDGINNNLHMQLTNLLYEYKKARNNIQSQMGKIVKQNMKYTNLI